jgi:HEAT repeat protein
VLCGAKHRGRLSPMKKRRLFWTVGLAACLVALPFLLWGGFATVGLLRGQHFYHGLPSGHWARAVRRHVRQENDWLSAGPLWLRELFGLGGVPDVLKPDPAAIPVVADLLREDDDEVRLAAFETLSAIGLPAVPVLVEAVGLHHDPEIREQAVKALWSIRPLTSDVMPAVRLLADRDDWPLVLKMLSLWIESPEAPSLFTAALHHLDVRIHKAALGAAGRAIRVGEAGVTKLAPVLREASGHDKDPTCRRRAAMLLEYIDPERTPSKYLEASEAHVAVHRAAYDPDSDVRQRAFSAVVGYYRHVPETWEVFLQAAHDYDQQIRFEAFIVVVDFRQYWSPGMIEDYLGLLTDPDPSVREDARRHLTHDREVMATISRALRQRGRSSPDPAFRRYAAAVVSDIGPILLEDIPPLVHNLHDPGPRSPQPGCERLGYHRGLGSRGRQVLARHRNP